MRYGIVLNAVGLALAFAWAPAATAQTGTPLAPRSLEGRVVSADPQDHSITVDWTHRATGDERAAVPPSDPNSTTKLELAPRATVVRDGLNVRADEVRPGDEVRASFLADDLTRTHPWQLEVRSLHGREAPWGVGTRG